MNTIIKIFVIFFNCIILMSIIDINTRESIKINLNYIQSFFEKIESKKVISSSQLEKQY